MAPLLRDFSSTLLLAILCCPWMVASLLIGDLDRLMVTCYEDRMEIRLSKDLDVFFMQGLEGECQPKISSGRNSLGDPVQIKTWNLTLKKEDGACGMKYLPVDNTTFWKYEVPFRAGGNIPSEVVSCTDVGMLDRRMAHIVMESMNTVKGRLIPLESDGATIEIERGATVRATFNTRYPDDLTLYPHTCWIINDRRRTKQVVIEKGCPLPPTSPPYDKSLVVVGAEDADHVTCSKIHVFFNADRRLLEDEDPSDLPSFRLQCRVFPCKGHSLFHQVIGIQKCPTVAFCQSPHIRIEEEPEGTFEINQLFSLSLSKWNALPELEVRNMSGPIYPPVYWEMDTTNASHVIETNYLPCILFLCTFLAGICIGLCIILCKFRNRVKSFCRLCRGDREKVPVNDDAVYQQNLSTLSTGETVGLEAAR